MNLIYLSHKILDSGEKPLSATCVPSVGNNRCNVKHQNAFFKLAVAEHPRALLCSRMLSCPAALPACALYLAACSLGNSEPGSHFL